MWLVSGLATLIATTHPDSVQAYLLPNYDYGGCITQIVCQDCDNIWDTLANFETHQHTEKHLVAARARLKRAT
jgi:hypothetical protein